MIIGGIVLMNNVQTENNKTSHASFMETYQTLHNALAPKPIIPQSLVVPIILFIIGMATAGVGVNDFRHTSLFKKTEPPRST